MDNLFFKNQEYKLSGNSGNLFIVGLLIGPILSTILAIIYAYVSVYNSMILVSYFVFGFYAMFVPLIMKSIIRFAKCRSEKISFIFILIIGIFSIYASWCTFLHVLSESANNDLLFSRNNVQTELLDWFLNPRAVIDTINILSIEGYNISYRSSEIFGMGIKGGFLWIIWIIEAGLILLSSWFLATLTLSKKIFCENCKEWIKEYMIDHNHKISMKYEKIVKNAIENNITGLFKLDITEEVEGEENPQYFKINLHHCDGCQNLSTIDVDLIKLEINEKGKIEKKKESYSPIFILNKQEFFHFHNIISGVIIK